MADQQITQLPEETGTVASTFPLAIVNVTAAETRKITTANLATAIFSNLSTGGLAASKVAAGYSGASLTNGTVTNAKLANSSVNFGGVSVALGSQDLTPSFNLQDATGYPCSSLTGTISNAQLAGSIAVSKLASSSVSFGGISVSLGSASAKPAFDLENATAYKTTNLVGSITNAQLGGSIANAKLANSSVSFGGISLALGASDPHPAFDLQDATGYKTTNLVGSITNAQLAGSIDASKLVANSLTTDQLGPNCVGASELANNAVDSGAVASGAITNDKVETSSSSSTGLDGATKLRDGSVSASKLNASTVGNGLAINSNVLSINNAISGATSLGLTFSNQGICTGIAALQASDLSGVLATANAVGVVKIPSSGGLSVSGSGDLSLASTVTAHTTRGIAVNAFGQVTSVSATVPSASLPVASTTAIGAIKVPSTSAPLTVDSAGILTIGVSGVTAGTGFTKFNVNDKGLVTSAGAITAAEIPNISAALLTSGSLDVARIAADSIGREKFSNNSTCIFGSVAQAGFPSISDSYRGELFFDTTEEDLYINDSNAWQPVTTLTKGSLKLGGVYSAATSAVTSVTSHGASVGLTVGQNLPTPTSNTDSTYLIVGAGGTPSGIPSGPTGELIPPDYLLSITSSTGSSWVEIDLSTTVSSPTAANVSVVSGYGGSSTNVQTALAEVYTDFLKLGGGNITGELKIESSGSLAFEGTANAYETRLTVVDPGSADRLITFPDATGTVVLQGQTSVVTSTMIDASLTNSNIAANAAIALSKIAAVSAGQILVGASGTGAITAVTVSGDIALSSAGAFSYVAGSISNADINASAGISASKIDAASTSQAGCVQLSSATTSTSATKAATPAAVKIAKDAADAAQTTATAALPKSGGALTGNLTLNAQALVRFADSDSSNFIALKAPATIASDITLTLPSAAPAANQILKANGSTPTTLEWAADGSATALQLTGGTLSGALNMGANNITNGGTITGTFVGNVTGNISGTSGGFTAGSASNLDSGTVGTARLGSGTASSSNFLRGDNTWQTIDLTALSATNLTSGTVPDARFPTTLPALNGSALTALNASNLSSGTVNVARLGSGSSVTTKFLRGDNTWQTISATPEGTAILSTGESATNKYLSTDGDGTCSWATVDLTALSASNLTSGTVPDARFPSTLPAASGVNLTALNASNISSGTISAARVPTLNQNTTGSAGSFTAGSASNLNSGTLPDARFPSTLPAISGANLTNLPASGPSITAVASGTLPNGCTVIVNSDGSVSKPVQASPSVGTEATISGVPATSQFDVCWDSAANAVVVAYMDHNNNNYGTCMAGTVSGSTISWGSAVVFYTYRFEGIYISFEETNGNCIITGRRDDNSNPYGIAASVKATGNSLALNGSASLTGYNYRGGPNAAVGSTSRVITTFWNSNNYNLYSSCITSNASGAPSWGSVQTIYTSGNNYGGSVCWDASAERMVAIWGGGAGENTYWALNSGGTSSSWSNVTQLLSYRTTNLEHSMYYDPDAERTIFTYSGPSSSGDDGIVRVGEVGSSSITFGSEVTWHSSSSSSTMATYIRVMYNPSADVGMILYKNTATTPDTVEVVELTYSGGSITVGTPQQVLNSAASAAGLVHVPSTGYQVLFYAGDKYKVRTAISSSMNSENFVGFSSAAYTNGQTSVIKVNGNTVTGLSSLTPGQAYYVQSDGSLGTDPWDINVLAGVALTSSSLLIK